MHFWCPENRFVFGRPKHAVRRDAVARHRHHDALALAIPVQVYENHSLAAVKCGITHDPLRALEQSRVIAGRIQFDQRPPRRT